MHFLSYKDNTFTKDFSLYLFSTNCITKKPLMLNNITYQDLMRIKNMYDDAKSKISTDIIVWNVKL